jgi:UDP-N-acetylmuramate dehydrogenase
VKSWRDQIEAVVRGEPRRDVPLAARTAIRVGGPADLLVKPADPDDLAALLRACRELGVPVFTLGGGANLLVADRGVRGVVLKLPGGFGAESEAGPRLVLSAGAPTSRLVARAQKRGLVGCEFVAGIPGTLGGTIAMNAGTRTGEMKDVVRRVEVATAEGAGWVDARDLGFGYRTCRLPEGGVVTRVEVELGQGDVAASLAAMRADVERRRATQPLDRPTFGSTFRNPPGSSAGHLIEAAGLKGHRIGGAEVSDKHANFFFAHPGARAQDIFDLMVFVQGEVEKSSGVTLLPEVRIIGFFENAEALKISA